MAGDGAGRGRRSVEPDVKTELALLKPFEYNTANLIASLSFYGKQERLRGLTLVTAPVNHSAFNVAVIDEPAVDEADLLFRVNEASCHFRALGRGWNFYVCEDMLDARTARRLDALLDGMGLVRILDAPGMETDELDPPQRELPELQYEPVSGQRARLAFTGLISIAFRIPYDTAKVLYLPEERWHSALQGWVGSLDGSPVTCAATMEDSGALGIYSVATLKEHRSHGCAEAIVRYAVSDYRRRGFTGPLVLQSTPEGRKLYRAMGFRRTTRFAVYATF
jgi:ribosomal protein S18 acetylase RimI-like enzyme